jgi:hypothetical protein
MNVVKQMMLEQRLPEKTMTVYNQALAVLLLELGRLADNVTLNNGRVVPLNLSQSRGKHILAHTVQSLGVGARSRRPDCCENLVGPSSHQHRVAGPKSFERFLLSFFVEAFHRPKVRVADYSVD